MEIARANASLRRRPIELARTPSYQDTYRTKIVIDPFTVSIEQKLDLLRLAASKARSVAGVFSVNASIASRLEDRFFASTEGSVIEQHVYQIAPEITTTAVEAGRKVKSRNYYQQHSRCAGYEVVEQADLVGNARRIGEEAVAHLKAPSVSPGVKDLVLLPNHLCLTIHESIGHSTELDRALATRRITPARRSLRPISSASSAWARKLSTSTATGSALRASRAAVTMTTA